MIVHSILETRPLECHGIVDNHFLALSNKKEILINDCSKRLHLLAVILNVAFTFCLISFHLSLNKYLFSKSEQNLQT